MIFINYLHLLFSSLIATTGSVSFQTFIPREVNRKNSNTPPTTYRRTNSFNNHSYHSENKQFYPKHHHMKHTCCFIVPNQCRNIKDGKVEQRTRKFTHLFSSNNKINDTVKLSKDKTASSSSYRFGDISKSFMKKLTKNDDYQWGDISRQLDKQAKEKVNQWTGKDEYEFGDLSQLLDKEAKAKVIQWTGKEKYEVGDISKEILKRIYNEARNHEFTMSDYIILFKILLSFGLGLAPVANFLPIKFLIEMIEYSAAADVSSQLVSLAIVEVDKKMKEMIAGDAAYKIGDISKSVLSEYSKAAVGRYLLSLQETKNDTVIVEQVTVTTNEPTTVDDGDIASDSNTNALANDYLSSLQGTNKTTTQVLKEDFDDAVWKEVELWDQKNIKRHLGPSEE